MAKVEHRIGVKAPASIVWEIVHDIDGWREWNPLYRDVAGRIGFGETLRLRLALPDQPERDLVATVLDWSPNEAIHWRTSALGGFLRTVRYLEIEAMSDTGCIFSNGEIFRGLLSGPVFRRMRASLRAGFEALGEAVRDRAEALWREREQGATLASR
ncbi:MAG TPA: SRPBCC domain-containing protein [Caulobacteraceae bacterium]|nr:SRPBCC domain-containing protein [Caulobacteraceae bacterium]